MAEEKILKEIDKLAGVVARGFEASATKKDLEELAGMVARGFEETGGKIDRLEERTGRLEEKTERIEQKIDALDMRLSAYISETQERMEGLRRWIGELEQRLKKVEKVTTSKELNK